MTNLAMRSAVNPTTSTVRENITSLMYFSKTAKKIQVALKTDKNNRYLYRYLTFMTNISLSSSENRNSFKQKLLRKSKHTFYLQ